MEKTTKKRKKSKSLKKRIGIIAVGALSMVLTVCLSVGATLAWFAGSTWASKSLYMGGPVYVEMAGQGGSTWVGGEDKLDIHAAANSRSTGTVTNKYGDDHTTAPSVDSDSVLLPGQRVEIYSQARVFTTSTTDTVTDGQTVNISSGANTTNTSNGVTTYYTESGRVTTSTSSVLRARFSINVEFDPSVGFNNFTDDDYMNGYPQQSTAYAGESVAPAGEDTTADTTWAGALNAAKYEIDNEGNAPDPVASKTARRDAVVSTTYISTAVDAAAKTDKGVKPNDVSKNGYPEMIEIQSGAKKSIYKWRYCSEKEWEDSFTDTSTIAMGYPFNGGDKTSNANGYYGVWVAANDAKTESDAFFKARTSAYLQSYVEYFKNEYNNYVTMTIGDSLSYLDTALNNAFVKLVNASSNAIIDSMASDAEQASWLYIDPSKGNDTNSNEISTSAGGWWYLVSCDDTDLAADGTGNNINIATDTQAVAVAEDEGNGEGTESTEPSTPASTFTRASAGATSDDRLNAKLYEIKKFNLTNEVVGINRAADSDNNKNIYKVVSDAFPFVNGAFQMPADALTNIFANAKLTFQISFQALQAFFPYTETIDATAVKDHPELLGTAKALNIKNAIPIYNEAFDYYVSGDTDIDGL